ncbi:MAG: RNA polymerase sigma factor [Saprospiraceae bacterium]
MKQEERTDQELVKEILEGNPQIFQTIIANTQGLVISIVYKMIKNEEDRKDLMQEVYLKVYGKLASFRFKAKLSTWIGTIAYNTCLNYLAKKKIPILKVTDGKEKETWESIETQLPTNFKNQPEGELFKKERAEILTVEIANLSPLYKTLITLYHQKELSYKEIGQITGLTEGTLKSYLFRARKELKDRLLAKYKKEDL